jgi:ClpP class serine protease
MAHELIRFAGQVFGTPQLITAEAFAPIADYLANRNSVGLVSGEQAEAVDKKKEIDIYNGVAFLKVEGPLTYRPIKMVCTPEGTSYTGLVEQAQEAISLGAKKIVFSYASGGGQAMGAFASANEVRQMANDAGVQITAFVEEGAHSAAYAWACTADEVVITPYASAGSIGCVCAFYDDSKALEKDGLKRVVITNLKGKAPWAEDGSFSEDYLAKVQEDVSRLGLEFAQHVSQYTGLSVDEILALDAQSFHAEKALEIGLVNKIMTPREFLNYVINN